MRGAFFIVMVISLLIGGVLARQSQQARQANNNEDAARGVERRTLRVIDRERVFYLYRPARTLKTPAPVVFALHGGGGRGLGMRRLGFEPLADKDGFVVVYPDGWNNGWYDGRLGERILRRGEGVDDVAFMRMMIDTLIAEKIADPARIYATGPSNGGIMSFRIACDLAGKVAAVAPSIANMPKDGMELCQPARPVPMLIINGTKDPLVPWEGGPIAGNPNGGIVVSVDETIALWKKLNRCGDRPKSRQLPDQDPSDGTRTTEYIWDCADKVELRLLRVEEGGHYWHGPVTPVEVARIERTGKVSRDFSGAEEVWRFFSRFTLPKRK